MSQSSDSNSSVVFVAEQYKLKVQVHPEPQNTFTIPETPIFQLQDLQLQLQIQPPLGVNNNLTLQSSLKQVFITLQVSQKVLEYNINHVQYYLGKKSQLPVPVPHTSNCEQKT